MAWIGAVASIAGSLISSEMSGSDEAVNAQQGATDAAIAENRRQFDLSRGDILQQNATNRGDLLSQYETNRGDLLQQNATNRADLTPYRTAGQAGVNRLAQLMGLDTRPLLRAEGARAAQLQQVEAARIAQQQAQRDAAQAQMAQSSRGAAPTREQFTTSSGTRVGDNETGWYIQRDGRLYNEGSAPPDGFDQAGYDKAMADWNAAGTVPTPQARQVAPQLQTMPGAQGAAGMGTDEPLPSDFGYLTSDIKGISPAKKFTLADFWDDPVTKASYAQGLEQGTKALDNMAGARGMRNSGATLKALTRFGIDYTGNQAAGSESRFTRNEDNIYRRGEADYGREVAKRDTLFNRLSGLSGTGQTAVGNTVTSGSNTANNIANMGAGTANTVANMGAGAMNNLATLGANNANTIGGLISAQGNARGAAAIAGGNAMSGGLSNAANTFGNWWNSQNNAPAYNNNYLPGQYDLNNRQYGG